MWWDRLLQGSQFAASVVQSASCPVYCGGSAVPWFLSGLCLGILLGLLSAGVVVFLWTSRGLPGATFHQPHHQVPSQHPHLRRRLSAYLE